MAKSKLTDRYAEILAEAARARDARPGDVERRGAPRVPVVTGELAVNRQHPVTTVDISISGVCFLSELPFAVGSDLDLSLAGVFSVSARVVGCEMEESDATFLETRYRVRCRFADEEQGMEVLVLTKEQRAAD
jgi:hypothetical protein